MTISSEISKTLPVVGNGVTTVFPFSFKIFQTSDVEVVLAELATGIETVLVEGSDYTVTMNTDQINNPGGSVTYPVSGAPMASTHSLTLVRNVPYTQGLDLTLGGSFDPDNIETALDRIVTLTQQNKEAVDRSVKVQVSAGQTPDDVFVDAVLNAKSNADSASASAAAAAASESNAGLSASAAATSEANALAYLQDFLSRYVGASATDPTTDGNGGPLTDGDLYWNTTASEFRVYNAGGWASFFAPGTLLVSAFMLTMLDDPDASTALSTLGVSAYMKTLLDDPDSATALATLGAGNTIWHSGNDGLGSGLDADLLDGLDSTVFWKNSDAPNSLLTNGYQQLPNGLIIQWGQVYVPSNSSVTFTFPIAFPTGCLIAVAESNATGGGGLGAIELWTATQVSLNKNSLLISGYASLIAIGY